MKKVLRLFASITLLFVFGCSDTEPTTPQNGPTPTPPTEENEWSIKEDINTQFIGGQAIYFGYDEEFPELDHIRLELWDAEPDPEAGTIHGNLLKCKLFVETIQGSFAGIPSGTYHVSKDPQAQPYTAEAGYDDGVNIPTGSYISQRNGNTLLFSMITAGEITISEQGFVSVHLTTAEGHKVEGRFDGILSHLDLSNREEQSDTPYEVASTLTEDIEVDLSNIVEAYYIDYGDYYQNNTRNIILQLIDETNLIAIALDLSLPQGDKLAPLPEGMCQVDTGDHAAWRFAPGMAMMGNFIGSYFCNLSYDGEYYLVDDLYGPATSGSVTIKPEGNDIYTLTIDWIDNNATTPHNIKCRWQGKLTGVSY